MGMKHEAEMGMPVCFWDEGTLGAGGLVMEQ